MRRLLIGLAMGFAALGFARPSSAQNTDGFALNRYEPTPAGDRFFAVPGADPGGEASLRLMLLGDYAYRPLVLYRNDGDDRVGSVISDQLYLHAGASLSLLDRLVLSLSIPMALVTEGDSPSTGGVSVASPSGASFGDLRLGARVRLAGEARGPVQFGVGASVWFPTGDEEHYTSDGSVRGLPALNLSGEASQFAYAIHGGILLRQERDFSNVAVGNEAAFGAAFGVLAAERKLQIGPELYGTTTLENGFERETTNLEAVLGLKFRVTDVVLGAAAGPGLTRGLGTPALRALLSVVYAPEPESEPPPRSDRDRDGIFDEDDACPDNPGIRSDNPRYHGCPDQDGDGVFDSDDACIDVPGEQSKDPKKNGCPSDRDEDGILDELDACPDEAGEKNENPKKNGCPPDRDGDGIVDPKDACPDIPGIASQDPQRNGCPGDRDGDGIFDDKDACPGERGKPDPDPTKNGCPTMVRVTEREIVILQQVQFRTASDQILPVSDELLEQVSEVFREHPEIKKVEIQGHTDNRGTAAFNQKLSERRAKSVVAWLVSRGKIAPDRFEAKGYGFDQPLAENATPEGRQINRRVQFKIVQADKPAAKEAP